MINIDKIEDEVYLMTLLKALEQYGNQILDISHLSHGNKQKVLAAYNKLQFKSNANKTPVKLSILTDKPKTVVLEVEDILPMEIAQEVIEVAVAEPKVIEVAEPEVIPEDYREELDTVTPEVATPRKKKK